MDPTEAYVDAAAATLGLHIAAEYRPAVIGYFKLAAAMAEQVLAVPLGAGDESASVFVPVVPLSDDGEKP
jgi:Protein of unknown function (DUF4089)